MNKEHLKMAVYLLFNRHGYLNVYLHDLHDCKCAKLFQKCLSDLNTDFANELHR